MPVVPGNALQQRMQRQQQWAKRPQLLGRNNLAVRILEAYDSDKLDQDGIPDDLAPLLAREPGTLFAKVQALKSTRILYIGFQASEAEIFKAHGNSVLLKGLRGTIIYNGLRPEEGRLVLQGESTRPLRSISAAAPADVVSFVG